MVNEQQRAYQRAYYQANKDKIRARTKESGKRWRAKNKELCAAQMRAYGQRNAAKIAVRRKKQRAENRDHQQAYARRYHAKNAESRNAKSRAWHAANKERVAARHAKAAREKPHVHAEYAMRRHAMKLKATPSWASREAILAIYEKAARLTRETGIPHTVDHIVPLQGKNVCGFHHEGNLQILTKVANSAKGNSFPVDGVTLQDGG